MLPPKLRLPASSAMLRRRLGDFRTASTLGGGGRLRPANSDGATGWFCDETTVSTTSPADDDDDGDDDEDPEARFFSRPSTAAAAAAGEPLVD